MSVKYGNFYRTLITTTGGISAGAMQVDVSAVDGIPTLASGEYCRALIRRESDGARELVKITAVTGLVLTITRAQEDTTALAFAAGDRIEIVMTKGLIDDLFEAQQDQIDTALEVANNALATAENASTLATSALARFPVQTVDIGDLQVTTGKLADDAVTGAKIADGAVDTEHLADGAVTSAKLDSDALTSTLIGAGANVGGLEQLVPNDEAYGQQDDWALSSAVWTSDAIDALSVVYFVWTPEQSATDFSGVIVEFSPPPYSIWYLITMEQEVGRAGTNKLKMIGGILVPRNWKIQIRRNTAEDGNPVLANVWRMRFQ